MLLAYYESGLKRLTCGKAQGTHVQQIVRWMVHFKPSTNLLNTSCLLFGVQLEVQIQHRAVLHAATQPLLVIPCHGHCQRKGQ